MSTDRYPSPEDFDDQDQERADRRAELADIARQEYEVLPRPVNPEVDAIVDEAFAERLRLDAESVARQRVTPYPWARERSVNDALRDGWGDHSDYEDVAA